MPKNENQKRKILYLAKILYERTDENHPLRMQDILSILENEYEIRAERKSIYSDIDALRDFGIQIETGGGLYAVTERHLSLSELKLLVDAVQASKFITHKKSTELIGKLERLAGNHGARALSRQVYVANRVKTMNESIYRTVDELHRAMQENRQISFRYFDWNMKKEQVLRHNGQEYRVSPWLLTWEDENYYLLAYDAAADLVKHFRADKIVDIRITEDKRLGQHLFAEFDAAQFAKKVFGMFGGEETLVILRCDASLAGVIFDRFGRDVSVMPDKDTFRVGVRVLISPQFFAWATGFGDKLVIESPQTVRSQMREFLMKAAKGYDE